MKGVLRMKYAALLLVICFYALQAMEEREDSDERKEKTTQQGDQAPEEVPVKRYEYSINLLSPDGEIETRLYRVPPFKGESSMARKLLPLLELMSLPYDNRPIEKTRQQLLVRALAQYAAKHDLNRAVPCFWAPEVTEYDGGLKIRLLLPEQGGYKEMHFPDGVIVSAKTKESMMYGTLLQLAALIGDTFSIKQLLKSGVGPNASTKTLPEKPSVLYAGSLRWHSGDHGRRNGYSSEVVRAEQLRAGTYATQHWNKIILKHSTYRNRLRDMFTKQNAMVLVDVLVLALALFYINVYLKPL